MTSAGMGLRHSLEMPSAADVLYLSFDGILDPLGQSQVMRVVLRLAQRGFRYHIVSLERSEALAAADRVEQTRNRLTCSGIGWTPLAYDRGGTILAAARNFGRVLRAALACICSRRAALLHARGYQACVVAWVVRGVTATPYLFDARGYWVDEVAAEGRWFTTPLRYRWAKRVERWLMQSAAGIVTLTEIQRRDLMEGYCGTLATSLIMTCPTAADYEEFGRPARAARVPPAIQATLCDKLVVAMVGSANRSYLTDAAIAFVSKVLERRPDSHLLIVTAQREYFGRVVAAAGMDPARYTIVTVDHFDMPAWLALADWCVLLLKTDFSKRASMPTKLAELFAAGVRPVQFGCNSEVSEWVERAGSGLVLSSLDTEELDRAASIVANSNSDERLLHEARTRTIGHFGLSGAVGKYADLLSVLIGKHCPT